MEHRHVGVRNTGVGLPAASTELTAGKTVTIDGHTTGTVRGWINTRAGKIFQILVPRGK